MCRRDPDLLACSLGAPILPVAIDAGQIQPISQLLLTRQEHVPHHPPKQLRAPAADPLEALKAVEAAIGQAQHPAHEPVD
jgi:hypothetical protein